MFLLSSFTIKVCPDCGKTRDRQGTDGAGVPGPREPFGVTAVRFWSPHFIGTLYFFLKTIHSLYVYFALFPVSSCDFVNLCCVCCHALSLFLMVLIFAFSSLLTILIGCLLSFLAFSVDQLLGFCQCPLLFTVSLISTVRVSFR